MYLQIIEENGFQTANRLLDYDLKILPILNLINLDGNWEKLINSEIGVIIYNNNHERYSQIRSSINFSPYKEISLTPDKSQRNDKISAFEVENGEFKLLFEISTSLVWKII